MSDRRDAILVLESGRVFRGVAIGAKGEAFGEVVFNTSITGYQEILTDPSYAGQIVAMTAPQIGNTGVNDEDVESAEVVCRGFVVREASPLVSNWRSHSDLDDYLKLHGVVGIEGVDTRALTRALREHGAQRGAISTQEGARRERDQESLLERVQASPEMTGRDLASQVTCGEPYEWDEASWLAPDLGPAEVAPAERHVVAYDFGIKRNILRELRDLGIRTTVVPATMPAREVLSMKADGYFLSNGPGDPAAVEYAIANVRELVESGRPLFGICLGHQILSLAIGARTYKLRFGHHGGNHPVADLATGKVEITAQNHGFAVDADSLGDSAKCTHLNLYDRTVEGIQLDGKPIFGLQYHPEASPGPHDANYMFGRFRDALQDR